MEKKTIRETNTVGIILEFLWGVFVIGGCSYLVFFQGASGWWFVLAVIIANVSISTKKTEYD